VSVLIFLLSESRIDAENTDYADKRALRFEKGSSQRARLETATISIESDAAHFLVPGGIMCIEIVFAAASHFGFSVDWMGAVAIRGSLLPEKLDAS